jgi:hypothetical protein
MQAVYYALSVASLPEPSPLDAGDYDNQLGVRVLILGVNYGISVAVPAAGRNHQTTLSIQNLV